MLVCKNISKSFNNKKAINNFSYSFSPSIIYSIMAPSGYGKSTLLSILSGSMSSYKGNVYFNNVDIKSIKDYTFMNVSFVYQSYQLFNDLTAYENVVLPLRLLNKDEKNYTYKIRNLFNHFQIIHTLNMKIKDLSGGEKQRIALIRALIKPFDILLLDEPTSALDEQMCDKFIEYLNIIKQEKIIIMVTHNSYLAKRADTFIDLTKSEHINIDSLKAKKKTKTISFNNLSLLRKKVFANKKIYNYFSISILSMGLISIGISLILSIFINSAINQSLAILNNQNNITFQSINKEEKIDFKCIDTKYDYIYYEGLDSSFKEDLKANSNINYVDFNSYDIEETTFIFDNYLSPFEENITLAIPSFAYENIMEENYINVYFNEEDIVSIPVDNIIASDDYYFYLYCNNVSYLYKYFEKSNIEYQLASLIYSNRSDHIYDYLMSSLLYKSYLFILDKDNDVIYILKQDYPRLIENNLKDFININMLDNYLLSDNKHTYIDFNSGFIYLLDNELAIQVVIDDSITNNMIKISSLYKSNNNINNKVILFDKEYEIEGVTEENNFEVIYMNKDLFMSFNDDIYYSGIIFNHNENIINVEGIQVKKGLFKTSKFKVIGYLTDFLNIFSIIIIIFALVSSIIIFHLNFIAKIKDLKILFKLGIYKENIIYLLLYDPITNIIKSSIESAVSVFLINIIIYCFYNYINHSSLPINFSLSLYVLILLAPIAVFTPFLIINLIINLNKIK